MDNLRSPTNPANPSRFAPPPAHPENPSTNPPPASAPSPPLSQFPPPSPQTPPDSANAPPSPNQTDHSRQAYTAAAKRAVSTWQLPRASPPRYWTIQRGFRRVIAGIPQKSFISRDQKSELRTSPSPGT